MAMEDPFSFWNVLWPKPAPPPPALATLTGVRLDLPTMLLRERPQDAAGLMPVLIVAPFALHDASIADFAPGHSIAQTLCDAGLDHVALTQWKTATPEMRDFSIDHYLGDLNVAVDDLGGCVALVGLCQGGWLAAAFAARWPRKVRALVLAGAPLDLAAAPSQITRSVAAISPAMLAHMVKMGGGRLLGRLSQAVWSESFNHPFVAREVLQNGVEEGLIAQAEAWNICTVDLPGVYFLQTAEWLFRENRLARGAFPVLGRCCDLAAIDAPIFVLAGAEDEVVPLPQALAVKELCPRAQLSLCILPCRHLSIFLGRHSLDEGWEQAARWLVRKMKPVRPKPGARSTGLAGRGA